MIKDLQVFPVEFRKQVVGYEVRGIYRDCSDSLWDPISHVAIFPTLERAQAFLAKVKSVSPWNLKMANWVNSHSFDGRYSVL